MTSQTDGANISAQGSRNQSANHVSSTVATARMADEQIWSTSVPTASSSNTKDEVAFQSVLARMHRMDRAAFQQRH